MSQERHRVSFLFIGILVCVPVLALYQFGLFPEMARWLEARLPGLVVLPESGLKRSLLLQYGYYTVLAFVCAWTGLALGALWKKFTFLLGLTYLTASLTVTLAWSGVLFEPFSGTLSAWAAGLLAVMLADLGKGEAAVPAPAEPATASGTGTELPEKKAEAASETMSATAPAPEAAKPEKVEAAKADVAARKEKDRGKKQG
ncbi:MAG TPA: hypothetical protein VGE29_16425 [Prosthecobacter sp.]